MPSHLLTGNERLPECSFFHWGPRVVLPLAKRHTVRRTGPGFLGCGYQSCKLGILDSVDRGKRSCQKRIHDCCKVRQSLSDITASSHIPSTNAHKQGSKQREQDQQEEQARAAPHHAIQQAA